MLNWYRALFRGDATIQPTTDAVAPPTKLVWGTGDPYLHSKMAPKSIERCSDGRLELIEEATHWLHHEIPDRVNELLVNFLEGA